MSIDLDLTFIAPSLKTVHMFPQELIDRLIDEVAAEKPSYYLLPGVRRDLRSCSLAARCFRSRSQRHLLAYAPLFIARGEMQSKRIRELRQILETSEAFRKCIIYFSIHLDATDPDDGDIGWKLHDENLPSVINKLGEIRELTCCGNPNAVEWDRLSEDIKTALRNTRFTSPHLSSLILSEISISPYDLVDTCISIKEIALGSVEITMGDVTSKNAPMLEHQLEKVRLSGHEFSLPLSLQNSQTLGSLRHFTVHFFRVRPCNIRQTWNVIHIASKSLEILGLFRCFGA